MINLDESALICDLAETYHIFNYKELSPLEAALFSAGLRENSRIKMKLNGLPCQYETLLLASIYDQLALQTWMKTKDAQTGTNRPASLVKKLLGDDAVNDINAYSSAEEFEDARKRLLGE